MRLIVSSFLALLSMGLVSAGCGGSEACPAGAAAEQDKGAAIIAARCTQCHDSSLQGADRVGAPEGYDFDDPEIVREKADEMRDAVTKGTMPKDGALSAEEVSAVQAYLDCLGD